MSNPLITVIVPVYKVEPYLIRCVDSIRNQTYRNLEIILVDDGSPDRCGEMCDALAGEDSRIVVIHKRNGGLSSARNAGLDRMNGEYVGFVDSDDWVAPNMYEVLLQRMLQEKASISCCGIARSDGVEIMSYFNSALDEQFTMEREAAMCELTRNSRITNSMCDKLFHKSIFDGLRMKEGVIYEDMQVQHYCLHRAQRITYTAEPMYFYFLSPGSILRGSFSLCQYDCIRASQERIAFFEQEYPKAVPYAKAMHVSLCLHHIYESRGIEEWRTLREGLIDTVKQPVPREVLSVMLRTSRIKRSVLCLGEKWFLLCMDLYTGRWKERKSRHGK